jgi:hypothetical protein
VREAIRTADDEVVEVVLGVQSGIGAAVPGNGVEARDGSLLANALSTGNRFARSGLRVGDDASVLDLGVDHDRKVRDPVFPIDGAERIEKRNADALVEHAAGELVRNFEIQRAGEHTLWLDEVDETL